jgi:hypothetical protein
MSSLPLIAPSRFRGGGTWETPSRPPPHPHSAAGPTSSCLRALYLLSAEWAFVVGVIILAVRIPGFRSDAAFRDRVTTLLLGATFGYKR